MLLQRRVQQRFKFNRSITSASANRSSYTLEGCIPAVTELVSCKANLSSNLDQFLSLSAEVQWKAQQGQNNHSHKQNSHRQNSQGKSNRHQRQGRQRRNSSFTSVHDQRPITPDKQAAPICSRNSWFSGTNSLATAEPQHIGLPAPVHARRPKFDSSKTYTRNTFTSRPNPLQRDSEAVEDEEDEKEGQMQGGRSQCTLQVRSTPGGELLDLWQQACGVLHVVHELHHLCQHVELSACYI